jgi:putative sigma-54 modulation protein
MRIITSGKNIEVTDALKDTIERKLGKLNKYFQKDTEAQVTLNVEKNRHIIEVTIPFDGIVLRCEECTDDMYTSIDKAVDKLERQIEKHKTKLERRFRGGKLIFENIAASEENEQDKPRVVRTKRFAMKPMPVEEAILQMELLGHNFFVFSNGDTEEVNVVYKRKDGNYGLIEPEF